MGLIAKKKGGVDYEPTPSGLHHGVCYGVIDIGTHEKDWQGAKYDAHEIIIIWEFPYVRIEINRDGKVENLPRVISNRYLLSLSSKANLCKDLSSWRGQEFTEEEAEGFDLKNLLGTNCQINVTHNKKPDRTYANISGIVPAPKDKNNKTIKIKPENPFLYFSFEEVVIDETKGISIPENMPEWIQKLVKSSDEWFLLTDTNETVQERQEEEAAKPADDSDDLPF